MRVIRGWVFVLMVFCAVFTAAQTMTVEQAIADLKNPDVAVHTRAAAFLWDLSGTDAKKVKPAVAALTPVVLDQNLNLRYVAMTILKNIGLDAKPAIPSLIKALDTFPGGTPPLDGPQRYYADARWAAADALGAIGPEAKDAIPALRKALEDASENVRNAAAQALKEIQGAATGE